MKYLDENGVLYVWEKTKAYIAGLLINKANKATTLSGYEIADAYTKTELDTKVNIKADKATSLAGYGIIDAYTKGEIDTKLSIKGDSLSYTSNKLALKCGSTILSEVTMNLGTQDYNGLSNKPSISGVSLQGDKTLEQLGINIPTKVSQLSNDSVYQTLSQVNATIASAVAGITQFNFQIVSSLPSTGIKGVIYLVNNGSASQNSYVEYIWIGSKYEKFGPELDLTGYVKFSDMVAITNSELDAICS